MKKTYLAVVHGVPKQERWLRQDNLGKDPKQIGRMRVDPTEGKTAKTMFRWLETRDGKSLVEASPVTGRTHQIRVHLLTSGLPIVGDPLYGPDARKHSNRATREMSPFGLRAVELAFADPFRRKSVKIKVPAEDFLRQFGFGPLPGVEQPSGHCGIPNQTVEKRKGRASARPK
jgi:23S rRNA pseudouridine1911/1915/1917 synthase